MIVDYTLAFFPLKAAYLSTLTVSAGGQPATTMTISPRGSLAEKYSTNSPSVPWWVVLCNLLISRTTLASRSVPKTSANCCKAFNSLNGDS